MSERERFLRKVQEYKFAAYDMLLYLDTHPTDKKAFELYKALVEKYKRAAADFEKKYGPLTAMSAADDDSFTWLCNPWPWDDQSRVRQMSETREVM